MDPSLWHGWRWDGSRWVRVSTAATIGQAHRELNKALPPGTPSTHGALTGGHVPTWRP